MNPTVQLSRVRTSKLTQKTLHGGYEDILKEYTTKSFQNHNATPARMVRRPVLIHMPSWKQWKDGWTTFRHCTLGMYHRRLPETGYCFQQCLQPVILRSRSMTPVPNPAAPKQPPTSTCLRHLLSDSAARTVPNPAAPKQSPPAPFTPPPPKPTAPTGPAPATPKPKPAPRQPKPSCGSRTPSSLAARPAAAARHQVPSGLASVRKPHACP
jgi:hypothetical protein